ncbi:MAG: helix-turn-helix domain-containing protein [Fervidicoccaceae archaeon]
MPLIITEGEKVGISKKMLKKSTIAVAHYGDILTDFTRESHATLIISQLNLIDNDSYMILSIMPSRENLYRDFLDSSKSYGDVKYIELLSLPGLNPKFFVMVKKNYGVLRALHRVRGAIVGPIEVVNGFKYFPVFIPMDSKGMLVKYIKEFSPCESSIKLLKPKMKSVPPSPMPLLSEREFLILRMAYESGYFDWPKRVKLEKLAEDLGISKATAAERLRKALEKLLRAYMTGQ